MTLQPTWNFTDGWTMQPEANLGVTVRPTVTELTERSVRLDWAPLPDTIVPDGQTAPVVTYRVDRKPSFAGAVAWAQIASQSATTLTVSSLTPGTSYDYRITPVVDGQARTPSTLTKATRHLPPGILA